MSKSLGYSIFSLLGLGVLLQITSCKHDPIIIDMIIDPTDTIDIPGDTIVMGIPCDPETVYFSLDIQPILTSNCALSGCHNAASHQKDVILTDYNQVFQTGDIEPFDLSGSDLYEVITDNDLEDRMPPSPAPALNNEQINLIAKWILQGAENLSCDPNAGVCDTFNISYSQIIVPILQNTCIGCHGGSMPAASIDLSDYSGVETVALNGRLFGAVSHDTAYAPMPQGGNKLPDCTIAKINAWINEGAQNN